MTRKYVSGMTTAATSILLTLIALEAVVRVAGFAPPLPKLYRAYIYVPHPILPYHQKPSITRTAKAGTGEFTQSIQHNRAGYRDCEHTIGKADGTLRILGVGDSFTYGAGVDFPDTYLALLERKLNASKVSGMRVEIIKAGIGGFAPHAERLLVEHEGMAYQPDLILVGFNETDIVETHIGIEETRLYSGFLKNAQAKRFGYTRTWLILHSHLARLVHGRLSNGSVRKGEMDLDDNPAHLDAAWDAIGRELSKINQLAASEGAKMAVCYIPLSLTGFEFSRDQLTRLCKHHGIPVIDASPYLVEASQEGAVYWPRDGHCNARGYRAISQALFDTLVKKGGILFP
jgi:lysophospholipase L1-like esterase